MDYDVTVHFPTGESVEIEGNVHAFTSERLLFTFNRESQVLIDEGLTATEAADGLSVLIVANQTGVFKLVFQDRKDETIHKHITLVCSKGISSTATALNLKFSPQKK